MVDFLQAQRSKFNAVAGEYEPFVLFAITSLFWFLIIKLWAALKADVNEDYWSLCKRKFTRIILKIPGLGYFANKEINKVLGVIDDELMGIYKNRTFQTTLPARGSNADQVMKQVDNYMSIGSIKWQEGRVSGGIYSDQQDTEFLDLMSKVYRKTAYTNPLHADVFPGIRKMEAEVVRMTCNLYKGGPEACGVVSTGGTESIVLAVKAYRNYAKYVMGIRNPEIIVPITAHPAFDKAAELLKVQINHVPVDPITKKVYVKKMKAAINGNTCLLVGSAPAFPHGIYDPIEEIAKLGKQYNIPVHVDACLGGFLNPFVADAGYKVDERFDFSVPGVTSITADTHKYGYAPKGTSVVMYANNELRRYQYFVTPNWPGGLYASPTILGSRPGGVIADCWAALIYHGHEGYVSKTKAILEVTRYFIKEAAKIQGLKICGSPKLSVVALTSDDFNIFLLSDNLTQKGWNVNVLQFPSAFHICFTLMHTKKGVIDNLLQDIREIASNLYANRSKHTKLDGQAALYGMSQSIPDRSLISYFANQFIDSYYSTQIFMPTVANILN